MTRDPVYDAMKSHSKSKFDTDRARFMAEAVAADDGEWFKHTEFHWSRDLLGQRLQYWPSRKKYRLGDGKVKRGDVFRLIEAAE